MNTPVNGTRLEFNFNHELFVNVTPIGEAQLTALHEDLYRTCRGYPKQWRGLRRNSLGYSRMQAWSLARDLGATILNGDSENSPVEPIMFRSLEDPFHMDDPIAAVLTPEGVNLVLEDTIENGVRQPLTIAPEEGGESIMPFSTALRAFSSEMYLGNIRPAITLNFAFLLDGRQRLT